MVEPISFAIIQIRITQIYSEILLMEDLRISGGITGTELFKPNRYKGRELDVLLRLQVSDYVVTFTINDDLEIRYGINEKRKKKLDFLRKITFRKPKVRWWS